MGGGSLKKKIVGYFIILSIIFLAIEGVVIYKLSGFKKS